MNIDTKERLIAAGIKLMLGGGFSATGIKDVVEMAGVPKGSFYYYFDSKDVYAAEIVDRYAADAATARAGILGDTTTPPLVRLRRSFEAYLQYYADRDFIEGCLLGNLSVDIAERSEQVRTRLRAAFRIWETEIAMVLNEAKKDGTLPFGLEPAGTASFLLNAWEGALVRMKAEGNGDSLHTFLGFYDRLLQSSPMKRKGRKS